MAKTAAKLERIVDQLRNEIVTRKYPPASRLPTRIELEQHFKVSSVTIQRALDRLVEEGFVEARGRRGTFVVDYPPHLSQYAVVFPSRPNPDGTWNQIYNVLRHEANRLGRDKNRRVTLFYGIQGHGDISEFEAFCESIVHHHFAGLFFAVPPFPFKNTPILEARGIPRVAFQSNPMYEHVVPIGYDDSSFRRRAAEYLADRGCRKLGVLTTPSGSLGRDLPELRHVFNDHGIQMQDKWIQCASFEHPQWSRNIMNLMMAPSNVDRPDCILIRDDNLLPDASLGLRDAGIGEDSALEVLSLYNFPLATESAVRVTRLGFDAREMLRLSFDYIDAMRRGESVPSFTRMPAEFEHELHAKYA